MQPTQELKQLTDLLINDESNWGERRESLQQMHSIFVSLNQFDAFEPAVKVNEEWLTNGCAISPRAAAMCLFEISRTRLFVKGIIKAIEQLLKEQTARPLQILDAGCGPYALLSLLAAQYFTAAEVQFHLLDIHETNIHASKVLVDALKLADRFGSFTVADACIYQWPYKKALNMVITETMLNALRKEPQVAITLNLAPQLNKGGILIPEKIEVDLVQVDAKKQNLVLQEMNERMDYSLPDYTQFEQTFCNIITLTKDSTAQEIERNPLQKVTLPDNHRSDYHYLQLHTRITVFDQLVMHHSDSSLTMPLRFSQPNTNPIPAGSVLAFHYNTSTNPGVGFEFVS